MKIEEIYSVVKRVALKCNNVFPVHKKKVLEFVCELIDIWFDYVFVYQV